MEHTADPLGDLSGNPIIDGCLGAKVTAKEARTGDNAKGGRASTEEGPSANSVSGDEFALGRLNMVPIGLTELDEAIEVSLEETKGAPRAVVIGHPQVRESRKLATELTAEGNKRETVDQHSNGVPLSNSGSAEKTPSDGVISPLTSLSA